MNFLRLVAAVAGLPTDGPDRRHLQAYVRNVHIMEQIKRLK